MHLVHGSPSLINHLELPYQMIFNCEQVLNVFFLYRVIIPVCKKGKDSTDCQSHHPITVFPVLCKLMDSLVINMFNQTCSMPENQFGFKNGLNGEHLHSILVNVILKTVSSEDPLFLAGHNISRACHSGIHPQLSLEALLRGMNISVIATLRNMYRRLNVKVKSLSGENSDLIERSIPVHKSIRQGTITSPPLFNNSVIDAQKKADMSFIFEGLGLSLLNYADDVLNLRRTLALIEKNFASLSEEYNDIGLNFNPSNSECIKFNSK
ncbi:uncharacterized protein LOC136042033 [Artemia franciscana]|uniref:uncharacterized protein LOC136042033 n=1 Tax=Artemia franciscana TaxID=6661 RepID=UPI0032DBC31C